MADIEFQSLARLYEEAVRDRDQLSDKLALFGKLVDLAPAILWVSDKEGQVSFANSRWTEITGASMDLSTGSQWLNYIDERDRERLILSWAEATKRGVYYETEYRILRIPDGEPRWFVVKAIPITNEAGQVERWFGCNTDVHDLRVFREELAKRVSELSAINAEAEVANALWPRANRCFALYAKLPAS